MDLEDVANMGAYTIAEAAITMIDSGDSLEEIRRSLVEVIKDTEHSVPAPLRAQLRDINSEYKGE